MDGRVPSGHSGGLYRRLDRHFPISEMASAARSHNPLRHHPSFDPLSPPRRAESTSSGSSHSTTQGSASGLASSPNSNQQQPCTNHAVHSQGHAPLQGVLRHPGQARRPTSRRRRPSFNLFSGPGQRRLNAGMFDLSDTVAATSAATAAAAAATTAATATEPSANRVGNDFAHTPTRMQTVRVGTTDIGRHSSGTFQHNDIVNSVHQASAPQQRLQADSRMDHMHSSHPSRQHEILNQWRPSTEHDARERSVASAQHSGNCSRVPRPNTDDESTPSSRHGRAPSVEYRAFEAEAFRLGRPGEFEGRYGTEHIAHPPRLPPLELPHASPGLCYSRTIRYSAFAPMNLQQAMREQVWLRFLDDRDKQVAIELRPPNCANIARREKRERGIANQLRGRHEELAALTDSYGNLLLKLHGRYVEVDPYENMSGRHHSHSRSSRPTLREMAVRTTPSLFVVVVSNEWNEPLFTVAIPPHLRVDPRDNRSSGHDVSVHSNSIHRGHPHPFPRNMHPQPVPPMGIPRPDMPPAAMSPPQHTMGLNGGIPAPYINDDLAYARRIAMHNAAACMEDVALFDGFDMPPPTGAALHSGSIPDEINRGISAMSISSGSGYGSRPGAGGFGAGRSVHDAHGLMSNSQGMERMDREDDDDLLDPLSVDAFYGELDAPNRPVDSRPLLRLIPTGDISQDILVDVNSNELAVVTHAADEDRRVDIPIFGLVLHPGVDVTVIAALVAARMWLEEHGF